MNPKSPTALIIGLIAIILVVTQTGFSLGLFANLVLFIAFLAAAFVAVQRRSKS